MPSKDCPAADGLDRIDWAHSQRLRSLGEETHCRVDAGALQGGCKYSRQHVVGQGVLQPTPLSLHNKQNAHQKWLYNVSLRRHQVQKGALLSIAMGTQNKAGRPTCSSRAARHSERMAPRTPVALLQHGGAACALISMEVADSGISASSMGALLDLTCAQWVASCCRPQGKQGCQVEL